MTEEEAKAVTERRDRYAKAKRDLASALKKDPVKHWGVRSCDEAPGMYMLVSGDGVKIALMREEVAESLARAHLMAPHLLEEIEQLLTEASGLRHKLAQSEKNVAFWQEKAQRVESDRDAELEARKQIRLDRILRLMPRVEIGFPLNSQAHEAAQRLAAAEHVVEIWAARGDK